MFELLIRPDFIWHLPASKQFVDVPGGVASDRDHFVVFRVENAHIFHHAREHQRPVHLIRPISDVEHVQRYAERILKRNVVQLLLEVHQLIHVLLQFDLVELIRIRVDQTNDLLDVLFILEDPSCIIFKYSGVFFDLQRVEWENSIRFDSKFAIR